MRGVLALVMAGFVLPMAWAGGNSSPTTHPPPISAAPSSPSAVASGSRARQASFGQEKASPQALHVANWVVASADNQGMPFMIIDKVRARVMMFDAGGQLQGAAPALLGLARGDDSAPGIGDRKMSSILPEERTTAAGRFVASLDRDVHGQEFLWIDYSTALSLHRVVKGKPSEQRAQRLNSATPRDNRISYGCVNVPVKFYETLVSPAFTGTNGIVYILPETRAAQDVFGSYDLDDSARRPAPVVLAAVPTVPLLVQQPGR